MLVKLTVSMVESCLEIGPSVLGRRAHVPLMDGVRVGAHGFKDANGGSRDCGPSDVIMANRKELELSLASPDACNG